jgi:hypothetical protein
LPDYPLVRSGGLFLVCVGLGLVAGTLLAKDGPVNVPYFFAGIGMGVITLCFAKFVSFGPGTSAQYATLGLALVLQALLIAGAARFIGPMPRPEELWYRTMIIVGIHFLPMAVTFGPRMAALGFACIAISTVGLLIPGVPFAFLGLLDGALKVGFGAWMLSTRGPRLARAG